MAKNPKNLKQYLSEVRAWAVVAVAATFVLLGWYGLHAFQYYQAWSGIRSMNNESQAITSALNRGVPRLETVALERDMREQELEQLQGMFYYPDIGSLMGTISRTALENDVELGSIAAAEPSVKQIDGMEYQAQSMTISLAAPPEDLFRFLAKLHSRVPVMGVSSITMLNPGPESSTEIQVIFYLSPHPVSDDEGAN